MMRYNLVFIENKQCIPFLNLTRQTFYDKLWEWTYEDDLLYYIDENNSSEEDLLQFTEDLLQFINDNVFHKYEDDDVDCFAFVSTDEGIVEYEIGDNLIQFIYNKIKEYEKLAN